MSRPSRVIFFQICGLLIVFASVVVASKFLPLAHWLKSAEGWMAEAGPTGMALFPLAYAMANLLLLPGGILNLGAGFFFGVWTGFLLVLAGSVLSASASFWIGRTLGRSWLEEHWLRNPKWMRLDQAIEKEGWKIILLSQLNPLFPTSLINYLYGISRIRFRTCILSVAIGQAPARLLYAWLGAASQYGLGVMAGGEQSPLQHGIWIAGTVAAVVATAFLGAVAHRILRKLGADPELEAEEDSEPDKALPEGT